MTTLIGSVALADGSTVNVIVPDDGGLQVDLRPFSANGATPATATLATENALRLAGLINAGVGVVQRRLREQAGGAA